MAGPPRWCVSSAAICERTSVRAAKTFARYDISGERLRLGFRNHQGELLEFDGSAGFFDFGLDLFGFLFRDTFFEGRRNAFDHLLGFHE